MKKLVIISLDLLAALPILTIAFALFFSSVGGTQPYLLSLGVSQAAGLREATASQLISSQIDGGPANYSTAEGIASRVSSSYNVSSRLVGLDEAQACEIGRTLCRLVTISGNAYLLVVSYEGAG